MKPHKRGFLFTTEHGIEYLAHYSDVQYLLFPELPELEGKIFVFGFQPLNQTSAAKLPVDPRVMETLATTIDGVLAAVDNAIIYFVDNTDGRHAARARVFYSWYKRKNSAQVELFRNRMDVKKLHEEVFSAILVPATHPLKERVVYRYYKMINELANDNIEREDERH